MEVSLTLGERMAVQWLLISAEGYDLDGARHQKRVMRKLDLAAAGNQSLAEMDAAEGKSTVYALENGDVTWLRDQIKKRFDERKFNPITAGYGAEVLDKLDLLLKTAADSPSTA